MLIRSRRDIPAGHACARSPRWARAAPWRNSARSTRSPPASNYQALVCIFLTGGNDGHNTVIPITTAQQNYSLYQTGPAEPGDLPPNSLLPIAVGADTYGLHPSLVEIQSLYNAKHAAILANVGMLVTPTTRASYNLPNAVLPNSLFSHSDQTGQWQTAIPTGLGSTGWGGRMADQLQALNAGAQFPADHLHLRLRTFLHRPVDAARLGSSHRSGAAYRRGCQQPRSQPGRPATADLR